MKRRFLFLIDDGWRFERRELLDFLKGNIDFGVATHDDASYERLKDRYDIVRIPIYPFSNNLLHGLVVFFARELDTTVRKTMWGVRTKTAPLKRRLIECARRIAGKMGLRRYSYEQAFRFIYRNSGKYADVLKHYDALVYSPVHVHDKRIVFEAEKMGLKIVCWCYSWDNPLKDNEFPSRAHRFLVWNEATKQLVEEMYHVPGDKIEIVGPVQFDYLLERDQNRDQAEPDRPYVLFTCTTGGYDFYVNQEIELILLVRRLLDEISPSVRLVVRPYPAAGEEDAYRSLRDRRGIEMVDCGTFRKWGVTETDRDDVIKKTRQMENALCMINLGSTIALEASFTPTPVIQICFNLPNNYPSWQDLALIYKNEHLQYMIDRSFPNVAGNEDELKSILADIAKGQKDKYMAYSKKLQQFANPMPGKCYKQLFLESLGRV